MAIKRLDPNEIFRFVSKHDDSIDTEKSDMNEFSNTRDYKKLVFKEGMQPTFFLVKNIGARTEKEIKDGHFVWTPQGIDEKTKEPKPAKLDVKDESGLVIKYFEAGVSEVEDYKDGQLIKMKTTVDEWPSHIVSEIGSFIMMRTNMAVGQKKS